MIFFFITILSRILKRVFCGETVNANTCREKPTKVSATTEDNPYSSAGILITAREFQPTRVKNPLNKGIFFFRPFNTIGALERAKRAVEESYAVVGVLEDLNSTLTVLEHYIPRFFQGATHVFRGMFWFSLFLFKLCIYCFQMKWIGMQKSIEIYLSRRSAKRSRTWSEEISREKLNFINSADRDFTDSLLPCGCHDVQEF